MTDHAERARSLLRQGRHVGRSLEQLAFFESAVREADLSGDLDLSFNARKELAGAAEFTGAHDKMLVACTWCIQQCDADPERFPIQRILWEYKWVVSTMLAFPAVPLSKIDDATDDFERRCRENGYSSNAAYKLRHRRHFAIGDFDAAEEWRKKWRMEPRDRWSDCDACDASEQASYFFEQGRDDEGMEVIEPVLYGSLSCAEEPQRSLAKVLVPLIRLGRAAETPTLHIRGLRMMGDNPAFLPAISHEITYLALTDNITAGIDLLQLRAPWSVASTNVDIRMKFFLATATLCDAAADRVSSIELRLPREFPSYRADDRYDARELGDGCRDAALAIARRFDERNGTTHYTDLVAERTKLLDFRIDLPLPGVPKQMATEQDAQDNIGTMDEVMAHVESLIDRDELQAAESYVDRSLAVYSGDDVAQALLQWLKARIVAREDLDTALAMVDDVEPVLRSHGRTEDATRTKRTKAAVLCTQGDLEGGLAIYEECRNVFTGLGDRDEEVRSRTGAARAMLELGRVDESEAAFRSAMDYWASQGNEKEVVETRASFAAAQARSGQLADAAATLEPLTTMPAEGEADSELLLALLNARRLLVSVLWQVEGAAGVAPLARETEQMAVNGGFVRIAAAAAENLCHALKDDDDRDEYREVLTRCIDHFAAIGEPFKVAVAQLQLAWELVATSIDEAIHAMDMANRTFIALEANENAALSGNALARWYLSVNEPQAALRIARQAFAHLNRSDASFEQQMPNLRTDLESLYGDLLLRTGTLDEAIKHLSDVVARLAMTDDAVDAARARCQLAKAYWYNDRNGEALTELVLAEADLVDSGDVGGLLDSLDLQVSIRMEDEAWAEAVAVAERMCGLAENSDNPGSYARCLYLKGNAVSGSGDETGARRLYEQAAAQAGSAGNSDFQEYLLSLMDDED